MTGRGNIGRIYFAAERSQPATSWQLIRDYEKISENSSLTRNVRLVVGQADVNDTQHTRDLAVFFFSCKISLEKGKQQIGWNGFISFFHEVKVLHWKYISTI